MPQAIGDPEEIERFAHQLKAFTDQMRDGLATLQGGFSRLGDTWRDQEFQKFAQDYQQTVVVMRHFIQSADAHLPLLRAKARKLRDYLG
jgi:uncharacterized protein YukE